MLQLQWLGCYPLPASAQHKSICIKLSKRKIRNYIAPIPIFIFTKNDKSPTCNAPIPAFPRVHIDGADASALAKARLEVYMHTWKKDEYKQLSLHSWFLKDDNNNGSLPSTDIRGARTLGQQRYTLLTIHCIKVYKSCNQKLKLLPVETRILK